MSFKREPEKPRTVELWVESSTNGRYRARTLRDAYEVDVNKAVKGLEKFIDTRWPSESVIRIVEVKDE